ncbi:acyltransferase family protein [Methylobacterium haplocladii]|uniref:acyltransferase family protein n=1 Tax=Methylobacterium haplocladii TaxID=1176176 RepID=UPI0011BE6C3B|nr:acyltransferase [Methylobacterium haplocladii]GJD86188.1 O-acetyltransferase OatA [Methylobacterium haplocladii]
MTADATKSRSLRLAPFEATGGFIPSLNGLRAISIIIVFLSHTVNNKLFPGGFGVRVFFLISGFLIARLLYVEWQQKSSISLRSFYIRRFVRLYPLVIIYTAVILLIFAWRAPDQIVWQEPASALLYYANYYYSYLSQIGGTSGSMPFGTFWSLSVEEHFYIFFPVMFVLLQGDPRRMVAASFALIVICLFLRCAVATIYPQLLPTHVFYFETQYQIDSIAVGVALASLCEYDEGRSFLKSLFSRPAIVLAVAMLVAGFAIRSEFFRETVRYTIVSSALFILLVNILFADGFSRIQSVLNIPIMDWIGRLSYSIYIWHFAVRSMLSFGPDHIWWNVALWTSVTLGVSAASYYFIERPISGMRHHFSYRVERQPATS